MKKKVLYIAATLCFAVCLLLYFYRFTTTDAVNISTSIYDADSRGWTVTQLQSGEETPLSPEALFEFDGTAVLRRTIPDNWAEYDRVNVDTGRAMCIFVDDTLVFSNFKTDITQVCELPLMQPDPELPFFLTFSFQPQWVGKTMTLVTRLYENSPYYSAGIELVSDNVLMLDTEAWTSGKTLPAAMFGLLSLLLFGLLLYQLYTGKKSVSTLLLTLASLCQLLIFTSDLHESLLPWNAYTFFTGLFFLLPLIYVATRLTKTKKLFLISSLIIWGIYFSIYFCLFHLQLPLPYWLDRIDVLCLLPVGLLLYCCIRERRENSFAKQLLYTMGAFLLGYLILFAASAAISPKLFDYIKIIFIEAFSLYCRPLLSWIYTTLLFSLFILAVWETLQGALETMRQNGELRFQSSLMEQSLKSSQRTNEALAVARHDELHHLRTLAALCREQPERAAEYASSLVSDIEAIPTMRFTENRLVNAILTVQSDAAARAGVSFEAKAKLPEHLPLPEQDVSTVLMNLTENALEAAKNTPEEKKRSVTVSLEIEDGMLLVTISNSLPLGFDKNTFRSRLSSTTKQDNELHGYGIRSVRSVVARFGGELRYSVNEDILTVNTAMELRTE